VDGYKVNVPEALKGKIDAEVLAKDEGFKGFMGKLHAAGASQKVVDAAVATMLERGMPCARPAGAAGVRVRARCARSMAGSRPGVRPQAGRHRVQRRQADLRQGFDGMEAKGYGNDPDFIRGLATSARRWQEDRGPSPEAHAADASPTSTR
jgi:hypothetical protein